MRFILFFVLVGATGCASDLERHAATLARADLLDVERRLNDPDQLFETSLTRLKYAFDLRSADADAGDAARAQVERAVEDFGLVVDRHPSFSRRGEAQFWLAAGLSQLGRWREARDAWRSVPPQDDESNRRSAIHWRHKVEQRCAVADAGC